MYASGDIVNNGYATFEVIVDYGKHVSLKRLDVGKTVCPEKVIFNKKFIKSGDLRKVGMEIDFV